MPGRRLSPNASPNSEVGRIRTYRETLDRYLSDLNIVAEGGALGAAANKTVTTDTVDRLNGLLGSLNGVNREPCTEESGGVVRSKLSKVIDDL